MRNLSTSKPAYLCALLFAASSSAFTLPKPTGNAAQTYNNSKKQRIRSLAQLQATAQESQEFDKMLEDSKLMQAVNFFRSHPDLEMSRERWSRIFQTIEDVTAEAEQNAINTRQEEEFPGLLSKSRLEMTDMYNMLKDQGHLRLFGSIGKDNMLASGSRTVRPAMLEDITSLSMKALTPEPGNTLLYAGVAVALLEGIASVALGINLNFLFFLTLVLALADRVLLNGGVSESAVKIIQPETQPKITRHEAGHFLCAYLLGCPVEGYVLSAWAALQDARFGTRGVSAGTSFFDPILSSQIEASKVARSSIDRYSIIVMGGIAAEAENYGRADGGAGDEMALIAFLSNLNGGPSSNPSWNDVTIRNQARWGALQSVLILREYKECYEALVDALERGGSLGDCIFAIEKAGRDHHKSPLPNPVGYIIEKPGGLEEEWTTKLPEESTKEKELVGVTAQKSAPLNPEESLETLRGYKKVMEARLKDIDEKLEEL